MTTEAAEGHGGRDEKQFHFAALHQSNPEWFRGLLWPSVVDQQPSTAMMSIAPSHLSRLLAVLAVTLIASAADAQTRGTDSLPASFRQPMPLYTVGLGPYSRRITTSSKEAQAFFDQGVQLLYSFTPEDAARSFREAQKRDPGCAMCHFGEAWSWGPYLNGPMSPSAAPRAHAAIQRAMQ